MQKRLPTELISPIVARVVAEHLDDLIAGSRSLLPKASPADEESTQPLGSKVQDSANPSDDPIKSLLFASFQIRKATLKVLGQFVGVAYEDEGVGRLVSDPWLVIEAVRMSYAEKLSLATAGHKDALESLTGRPDHTLLFVYVTCQRPDAARTMGTDWSESVTSQANTRVEALQAAGKLLRRFPEELTCRLFGRLGNACTAFLNECIVCYRAALDRIATRHAERIQPFRDVTPTSMQVLLYGSGLVTEYMSAVYAHAAAVAGAMFRQLFVAIATIAKVMIHTNCSNDVDSAIAVFTESLTILTRFSTYQPDGELDTSEIHKYMVDSATELRAATRVLIGFLERRDLSNARGTIMVRLSSKEVRLMSARRPLNIQRVESGGS